jgi:hypothetical protein
MLGSYFGTVGLLDSQSCGRKVAPVTDVPQIDQRFVAVIAIRSRGCHPGFFVPRIGDIADPTQNKR